MTIDTVKLLRLAGFGLWALSGLPLSVTFVQNPTLIGATSYRLWLVCFLLFGAAFALTGWRARSSQGRWIQIASLAIQTSAALVMIRLVCSGLEGSLLVIVAAQLGWLLPLPTAKTAIARRCRSRCWNCRSRCRYQNHSCTTPVSTGDTSGRSVHRGPSGHCVGDV